MNLQLYFRSVCHLSDARFASAAGAEFLGFPWHSSGAGKLTRVDYLDIWQWISGPVPVLQIHARDLARYASTPSFPESAPLNPSSESATSFFSPKSTPSSLSPGSITSDTAPEIVPEALEVSLSAVDTCPLRLRPDCPILWKPDPKDPRLPVLFRRDYDYLLLDPGGLLPDSSDHLILANLSKIWVDLCRRHRCFLEIPTLIRNPLEWVGALKPYGISLSGQPESAVGKRDYSVWQDLTDQLEKAGLR
ncbi:MAG: hypothetical protein FJ344_06120 [Sphingomonadales bacterium]|nr:hypothetical protein [Sphingomonadales bacterium]